MEVLSAGGRWGGRKFGWQEQISLQTWWHSEPQVGRVRHCLVRGRQRHRHNTSCPTSSFRRGAGKAISLIAFSQPLPVGERLSNRTPPRRSGMRWVPGRDSFRLHGQAPTAHARAARPGEAPSDLTGDRRGPVTCPGRSPTATPSCR